MEDITIEGIANQAGQILLRDGYHVPTILAHTEDGSLVPIGLRNFGDTTEERIQHLFALGKNMRRTIPTQAKVTAFFIIHEAWLSRHNESNERIYIKASQDPNKIEVLLVVRRVLATYEIQTVALQMLRDADGRLHDIVYIDDLFEDEEDRIESPLMDALVGGFTGVIK